MFHAVSRVFSSRNNLQDVELAPRRPSTNTNALALSKLCHLILKHDKLVLETSILLLSLGKVIKTATSVYKKPGQDSFQWFQVIRAL